MNDDELIDIEVIGDMAELLDDEFPVVVALFLEDTQALLQAVHDAVAEGQHSAVTGAAHQIKSSSAYLGFTGLSEQAARLEQGVPDEAGNGQRALVAELELGFEFVCDYLQAEYGIGAEE